MCLEKILELGRAAGADFHYAASEQKSQVTVRVSRLPSLPEANPGRLRPKERRQHLLTQAA